MLVGFGRRFGLHGGGPCGRGGAQLISELHRAGERGHRPLAQRLSYPPRAQRRPGGHGDSERRRKRCRHGGGGHLDLRLRRAALGRDLRVVHDAQCTPVAMSGR